MVWNRALGAPVTEDAMLSKIPRIMQYDKSK